MNKITVLTGRALLLLALWSLAGISAGQSIRSYIANRAKAAEVAQLEQRYNQEMEDYASVLVEGGRLESDHDYRISLLKERFGYAEPDETPIVILSEPAERTSLDVD